MLREDLNWGGGGGEWTAFPSACVAIVLHGTVGELHDPCSAFCSARSESSGEGTAEGASGGHCQAPPDRLRRPARTVAGGRHSAP